MDETALAECADLLQRIIDLGDAQDWIAVEEAALDLENAAEKLGDAARKAQLATLPAGEEGS